MLSALAATLAVLMPGADAAARRPAPNPRPITIPAIREWRGGHGALKLSRTARVMVRPRDWSQLSATARLLAHELRLRAAWGRARPGDIALLLLGRDRPLGREGYQLGIGRRATIAAPTTAGVFYGTRTLLQLLAQSRWLPRGHALDWPQYPQRGLMLDLGRRNYPFSWLLQRIRELAYLKLNLLHLHLTDDQRWGIASDTHPEIVSAGALSKREVRSLLALAARYHVTVVPEIDMPAHMGALLAKHPDLELKAATASNPPSTPESRKLDITNPRALSVVKQLLDEYLSLFPGRYWDMGGDEYMSPADQPLYPQLATYAVAHYGPRATYKDTILGLIDRVDAIVRAHHRTLRAWHDELGPGGALKANPDIVAEWWIDFSPLSEPRPPKPQQLLSAGHQIFNAGWFPSYYTENLGPVDGKPDMQKAYESWSVNQFCSPTHGGQFFEPCDVISPHDPRNLGATLNVWDDHELTAAQVAAGIFPRLRVIAQKTWNSPELTASYARFVGMMRAIGSP